MSTSENEQPEPDPRFLGGETAVLTDARQMALVVAIGWQGECDLVVNVANTQAVEWLRAVADQIEARPSNVKEADDAD